MTNGNDWRDINMFKYIISYDGGQLRDSGDFEEKRRLHMENKLL